MQDQAFKAALSAEGQATSSVSTRLSDARRIEKHFGDLDAAFAQDGCAAIMQALTYRLRTKRQVGPILGRAHRRKSL